ncbi:MAG: RidA family protein [Bacteroidota bacterium]|nr:RidA family protein [Bacteroidota bacterium]
MRKVIYTDKAPKPIGPYSQAIRVKRTLYISGQIAIDPATDQLLLANIEEETHRVLDNIAAILDAAEMGFDDVVKCTVFVKDMKQFANINAVYATYFPKDSPPARETVEVSALPKGVNVEISCIAFKS